MAATPIDPVRLAAAFDLAGDPGGLFRFDDPPLTRSIFERATRVTLERGELLFRAGAPGDEIFIVLRGRLVALGAEGGGAQAVSGSAPRRTARWVSRAMTAGSTVGEIAMLTGGTRSADVMAVRRSELLRLNRADFDALCTAHPSFSLHVSRVLAERLRGAEPMRVEAPAARVIAVVRLDGAPAEGELVVRLAAALGSFGPCALVDAARAAEALGIAAIDGVGRAHADEARLDAWLADQEERHRFLLLDAGAKPTPWLARCLGQADHVLLVADADGSPAPRPVEAGLHGDRSGDPPVPAGRARPQAVLPPEPSTPPVSLALLHPADRSLPSGTARWLEPRALVAHHHLRAGLGPDVERLARRLAGRAVGLVLGGGGALGAAHLGVFEALVARGVPVDAVGGTSAGGGIGAQIAMGWHPEHIRRVNVDTWVGDSPFHKPTLPVLSLCARSAIDDAARSMFGDAQIEDLWTPFFCVSTDLTRGEARVHTRGPLWVAVRATASLPGVLSPMIDDGGVLVDGGVLDNLPVGPMKQLFAGTIVAVDIAREIDLPVDYTYDELPGPLGALWSRLRTPGAPPLPTIPRVLLRTITVASQRGRERSRGAADLLLEPPLERWSPGDFGAFDPIRDVARRYAEGRLAEADVEALVRGACSGA